MACEFTVALNLVFSGAGMTNWLATPSATRGRDITSAAVAPIKPTSAKPATVHATIFVGTSDSDSLIVGGLLIAADARTGAIKWVFNTVPQGPGDDGWELAKDTWPANNPRHGGGVWTQPAIDPALGMIYFNTANPAPDYDGSARHGANLFTDSMLALDLATGKLRWHFQTVHHDIWDKDAIAGPVLFDVTSNGRTIKGVGSSGKVCYVYLLDRATGQPINAIVETSVPTMTDVPGLAARRVAEDVPDKGPVLLL